MIRVNSGRASRRNRGMFTEMSRTYIDYFYQELAEVGNYIVFAVSSQDDSRSPQTSYLSVTGYWSQET
jgi:hypothetical protein